MGLFDFFGGGTPAEKAQKLKSKVTQKYGDATTRQGAIADLTKLKSPDTVPVLMQRFTFVVDPQTTDADEKETVFNAICALEDAAIPPVVEFLKKSDAASSWALKILDDVMSEAHVIGVVTDELKRLGAEYTRDPEKKEVLLHALEGKSDERIGQVVAPFLADMSDEVKLAALKTLASIKYEPALEPLLTLVTNPETAKRVQMAGLQALADTAFPTTGFQKKIEALLVDPYTLDKSGVVKRRGA
ncbi:MAG: HEAT repeat domain-containing protein [Archangium sp.]|nr:HEAT repeat domain-containing protein [Archangium sp.]